MKKLILLLIIVIYTKPVKAQDPQFSQFYANPVYLNPSLSGITNSYRATLNYRQQWGTIGYNTSSFSVDGGIGNYSGWGLQVLNDNQMNKVISTTSVFSIFSHRISISTQSQIGMGLRVGYYQKSLNWQNLIFEDQLDARYGPIYTTSEQINNININNFDFSTGLLFTSKNIVGGISINHINKPVEHYNNDADLKLPIKITVHAAGNLVNKDVRKKFFYISPNIIYEKQGSFEYWNLGMYYAEKRWTFGAWYRLNEAIIFTTGMNFNDFKIGYSHDLTVISSSSKTGNANEISLSYQFDITPKNKVKDPYKGKCPEFYKHML